MVYGQKNMELFSIVLNYTFLFCHTTRKFTKEKTIELNQSAKKWRGIPEALIIELDGNPEAYRVRLALPRLQFNHNILLILTL